MFFISVASGSNIELEGPTLNKDVTRSGVILIYCDLLITQHMVCLLWWITGMRFITEWHKCELPYSVEIFHIKRERKIGSLPWKMWRNFFKFIFAVHTVLSIWTHITFLVLGVWLIFCFCSIFETSRGSCFSASNLQ